MSIGNPYQIFTDRNGQPLEEGYIYIGAEGLNPQTNPIAVFWDGSYTIPADQPIRTSGGYPVFNGSPGKLFASGLYSISIFDNKGQLVFTSLVDNF